MSGNSTISDLFQLPDFDFEFTTADFEMELRIVSRLFDFGLGDATSDDEIVDMRGRGPRAPRVNRYPYNSRLYHCSQRGLPHLRWLISCMARIDPPLQDSIGWIGHT